MNVLGDFLLVFLLGAVFGAAIMAKLTLASALRELRGQNKKKK